MPKFLVKQAFTLQRDNGTTQRFAAGIHNISQPDSEHWFVKVHSEPVQEADAESVSEMQQIHAELLAAQEAFLAEKSASEKTKKAKAE